MVKFGAGRERPSEPSRRTDGQTDIGEWLRSGSVSRPRLKLKAKRPEIGALEVE